MTVSSTTNRKTFTGDGVTVAFGTSPVVFFDDVDLLVYLVVISTGVATLQTITTHYTVTGGDGTTGTVTMVTAPSTLQKLVIVRSVAATQGSDLVNNDSSDAEVIEDALDRLTMIAQQNTTNAARTLRQPASDPTDIDELPTYVDRASKYLAFDADGEPVATAGTTSDLVATAFIETLLDDASAAAARTTLGAVATGTDVPLSTFTTAGDVVQATGAGVVARLGIGTARQVLAVNSGATAAAWSDKITLAAEQASTSGTAITFGSIPAGVKKITVMLNGVSTNGTSAYLIRLGDAGGLEATGYVGTCSTEAGAMTTYDTGFMIASAPQAAATYTGVFTLYLQDAANFTWNGMGMLARSAAANLFTSTGSYALSAELTQLAITSVTPDTFDAGAISIQYE